MQVRKRDGSLEAVNINKIVRAIEKNAVGLDAVEPLRVASKTISGLYEGASTQELDRLSIQTAATLTLDDPQYSRLAARLMSRYIDKEVKGQEIQSFSQSICKGYEEGLINDRVHKFVLKNARKLNALVDASRDDEFEYFGIRTVYDRYLLKQPVTRLVLETPQYFFARVACALSDTLEEVREYYDVLSRLEFLHGSPTLFNAGLQREQLSSCYLLDSPADSLDAIFSKYGDVAQLSKWAGGIGLSYTRVRSRGSHIKGTNGPSDGIVPWLKILDSSVAAVNQGGRRKGAASVYVEPWHSDVEEFLELRDNTGDHARRTHNLHLANWIPDVFMRRVRADAAWSLFDPAKCPHLTDLYGADFDAAYEAAEQAGLASKVLPARELYRKMMRTLAQTGNGWMCFKDRVNLTSNQTGVPGNVVHSSNLCVEITEVTDPASVAVCNIGSVNLARHLVESPTGEVSFDFDKLAQTVRAVVVRLDRVIDINYYPLPAARESNLKWRPLGLGRMGFQDVLYRLGLLYDGVSASELSRTIAEEVYFYALDTSCRLAQQKGAHPSYADTRIAREGKLQYDLWGVQPRYPERWAALKERIAQYGLRNSLLIATAPTATIASIAGCYEADEAPTANIFKRKTLSGDFLQVNRYLVEDLKGLGLWSDEVLTKIKLADGSVQNIPEIPEALRQKYRTVWEIPMRAVIDAAAARGPFIDQSQSLNLFMANPDIGRMSSMYMYAWERGLKTTYYLHSQPASKVAKTVALAPNVQRDTEAAEVAAVACSIDNREACEACQ